MTRPDERAAPAQDFDSPAGRETLRARVRAGERVELSASATARAVGEVFGDAPVVAALHADEEARRWFEGKPLFGKRVLLTRAREQAGSAAALLREEGAEPLVVPTIEIHPPRDPAALARAIEALRAGRYGWVAFTSANGVERTWDALVAAGADARAFAGARIAAIGPATARALEQRGLHADVTAREFRGEGLAEEMLRAIAQPAAAAGQGDRARRVLLPRAAKAREALPEALRAAGCELEVVAAYETRPPPPPTVDALVAELESGRVDAVTFTSSSTVDHLCDLLGARAAGLLAGTCVASIGPVTSETARARGLRVDVTAHEYTLPGLVRALARRLATTAAPTRPSPG